MDTNGIVLPNLDSVQSFARVGLLGGSFDPPHLGHQLLALSLQALLPMDELWIVPCRTHALKNPVCNFDHRLAMCQIAFSRVTNVRVVDLENRLPKPSYTIQTIKAIQKARPDLTLILCLGSDLIESFHQWHEAEELTKLVSIAIFERTSYPIRTLPNLLRHAEIYQGYALPDTASTDLRSFLKQRDEKSRFPFLDREVLLYIEQQCLYLK